VLDFGDDRGETIRLVASFILLRRNKLGEYCPACTYFGGNGHSSPLVFHPAVAAGVKTAVTTRVSIDRLTGAAKQERLFTIEYVPPGAEFHSKVELAEDLSPYVDREAAQQFLKTVVPSLLRQIKQLGKHKSVGFGLVEVTVGAEGTPPDEHANEEIRRRLKDACDSRLSDLEEALRRKYPEKAAEIVRIVENYRRRVIEMLI
jgi:CRISPR/Cas system CSM-associated protein Csm3 (group 7 of RAMP superfamily)